MVSKSKEEIVRELQQFAIDNGRLPQLSDLGIRETIRLAIREFGSLEIALGAAGLLTGTTYEESGFTHTRSRRKSDSLSDCLVRLLDGSPMRLPELQEKVKETPGYASTNKVTIWSAIKKNEEIASVGSRRKMVYYLKGQEHLARKKLEWRSRVQYAARRSYEPKPERIPHISRSLEENPPRTLIEAITRLLDNESMSLKQIKEELSKFGTFSNASYGDILDSIRGSERIKRTYINGMETYSLEEESRERGKLEASIPYFNVKEIGEEDTAVPPIQEEQSAPGTLKETITKLLDGNPMSFPQLRERVRNTPRFADTQDGSIGGTLHQSKNIDSVGPWGHKVYFLKGQKTIATKKLAKNLTSAGKIGTDREDQKEHGAAAGKSTTEEPKTLEDVITGLLDNHPMGLAEIEERIWRSPGLADEKHGEIMSTLFNSKKIRWMGKHPRTLYYLEGQEPPADKKTNFVSAFSEDLFAENGSTTLDSIEPAQSETGAESHDSEMALPETKSQDHGTLADAIMRLLDGNPMSLNQLTEEVRAIPKFADAKDGEIRSTLFLSKQIKWKVRWQGESAQIAYYIEGQLPLALDKEQEIAEGSAEVLVSDPEGEPKEVDIDDTSIRIGTAEPPPAKGTVGDQEETEMIPESLKPATEEEPQKTESELTVQRTDSEEVAPIQKNEGEKDLVEVTPERIERADEGKLVKVEAKATAQESVPAAESPLQESDEDQERSEPVPETTNRITEETNSVSNQSGTTIADFIPVEEETPAQKKGEEQVMAVETEHENRKTETEDENGSGKSEPTIANFFKATEEVITVQAGDEDQETASEIEIESEEAFPITPEQAPETQEDQAATVAYVPKALKDNSKMEIERNAETTFSLKSLKARLDNEYADLTKMQEKSNDAKKSALVYGLGFCILPCFLLCIFTGFQSQVVLFSLLIGGGVSFLCIAVLFAFALSVSKRKRVLAKIEHEYMSMKTCLFESEKRDCP